MFGYNFTSFGTALYQYIVCIKEGAIVITHIRGGSKTGPVVIARKSSRIFDKASNSHARRRSTTRSWDSLSFLEHVCAIVSIEA